MGFIPAFFAKNRRNWGFVTITVSREGSVVEFIQVYGLKQAPGFEEGLWGAGVWTPTSSKESFTCQKCSFPYWKEKHSAEKCLCSFPCPHLEVLADFNFCFSEDSNFFCYQ